MTTCVCGKFCFTRRAAGECLRRAAAARRAGRDRGEAARYYCRLCTFWHVTSKKPRRVQRGGRR